MQLGLRNQSVTNTQGGRCSKAWVRYASTPYGVSKKAGRANGRKEGRWAKTSREKCICLDFPDFWAMEMLEKAGQEVVCWRHILADHFSNWPTNPGLDTCAPPLEMERDEEVGTSERRDGESSTEESKQ